MSAPIIDLQAIENLRALNPGDNDAFIREVLGIFLEDTPQRIAELDTSLAAGDAPKFSRAAHSIKGSSANLGAASLRGMAEQLEQRSHKEGLANVAGLLASLKQEYSRTKIELTRLFP
jgi:HPt (histidine-containing phosphotransfer) domain-containing protein